MEKTIMGKFDFLKNELDSLKDRQLYREPITIDRFEGTTIEADGRRYILFCSNNYISLSGHPHINEKVCEYLQQSGYNSPSSRLVSGTTNIHIKLEDRLARFFGKEAAMVLPAGFMANEALLRTLPQKGDLVLMDKLDHASIIDAVTTSDATFKTYRRGQYERIEELLSQADYRQKYVVTESIFSMDGDTADLVKLAELKDKYGAILIVDEAHAIGCMGNGGAGLAQEAGVLEKVDIVVGTMSKSIAAGGGIVAGPRIVREYLINKARSFIYTTALPIATCVAAEAAMDLIKSERWRRQKLKQNADYLRTRLNAMGINTGQSTTHIVPVIIGSEKDTVAASRELFERGFFISAIRPPTVPPASSRLRISLQTDHTTEQIDGLCEAIAELVLQKIVPVHA